MLRGELTCFQQSDVIEARSVSREDLVIGRQENRRTTGGFEGEQVAFVVVRENP